MNAEYTFQDVINHYRIKLIGITDDLAVIANKLKAAQEIVETEWQGKSSEACNDRINMTKEDLKHTDESLSEAVLRLSNIQINDINE